MKYKSVYVIVSEGLEQKIGEDSSLLDCTACLGPGLGIWGDDNFIKIMRRKRARKRKEKSMCKCFQKKGVDISFCEHTKNVTVRSINALLKKGGTDTRLDDVLRREGWSMAPESFLKDLPELQYSLVLPSIGSYLLGKNAIKSGDFELARKHFLKLNYSNSHCGRLAFKELCVAAIEARDWGAAMHYAVWQTLNKKEIYNFSREIADIALDDQDYKIAERASDMSAKYVFNRLAPEMKVRKATAIVLNKEKKALRLYDKAILKAPCEPYLWAERARGYGLLNDRKGVELSLETAVELGKRVSKVERASKEIKRIGDSFYNNKKHLLFVSADEKGRDNENGEYVLASLFYDAALKLTPHDPDLLFSKGQVLFKLDKYDSAHNIFSEFVDQKHKLGLSESSEKLELATNYINRIKKIKDLLMFL